MCQLRLHYIQKSSIIEIKNTASCYWSYAKRKDLCNEHSETSGNSYLADQLADLLPHRSASGSEWQFQILTVWAHIGRSTGRSTPPVNLPVDLNGNFRFLLFELILADQLADLPPPCSVIEWSRMVISHFYCWSSYWQMMCQIYWQIYPPPPVSAQMRYSTQKTFYPRG